MFENKGYNINIPYGNSAAVKFTLTDTESGEPFIIPAGSFLKLSVHFPKSQTPVFLKTVTAEEQEQDGSATFVFSPDETKIQSHDYSYTLDLVIPDDDICDTIVGSPDSPVFSVGKICSSQQSRVTGSDIAVSIDSAKYGFPSYTGSYLVEPSFTGGITLNTRRRSLSENITVKKVPLPDNIFTFSTDGLFRYPKDVVVPNTVTSLGRNTALGFTGHTEIETISFENGCTISTIPMSAFEGCTGLKQITLPNSITYVVAFAFESCTSLEELVFPASVTTIESSTSRYCTSLRRVVFSSVPENFYGIDSNGSDNIFCYNTAVEDVQVPQGWTFDTVISDGTEYFTNVLTHDSMVALIANLYDYSGGTTHTLTLGATNLARLSAAEQAAAAAKNWVLA